MIVNKFAVILLGALSAFTAAGADSMAYHPLRKVGTNYYDLRPLYTWCSRQSAERPLASWIAPQNGYRFTVKAVWEPDLLAVDWSVPAGPGGRKSFQIVLKNYPAHDTVADGDDIKFLALRTGVHRWTDSFGATHTLPLYDYGTPYWPTNTVGATKR
jgi:hypothetical protein